MATIPSSFLLPASSTPSKPKQLRHRKTLAIFSNPTDRSLLLAKDNLLSLISDQERGLKTQTDPSKRSEIIQAIDALSVIGKDTITTDASSLSATWRMLWTTEKEQLFIIKNAYLFGTQTGDVLQVIDVERGSLNNVITFPPSGVFFVRSTIEFAPPQRVNFKFTSAVLRGKDWEFPLPPFGQGWFESVYLDDDIRVVKDIRVIQNGGVKWMVSRAAQKFSFSLRTSSNHQYKLSLQMKIRSRI